MKLITYQFAVEINMGTHESPKIIQSLNTKSIRCPDSKLEANLVIARAEAYDGEVTVENIPDPETEPTQEEDTAAMLVDHEFRLTLLELGLTDA